MLGDPSGQKKERKRLTHEETLELAKTYTEQAFRVLDPKRTEVRYNSEWLMTLSLEEFIDLAAIFPMKQIIGRREFQERMDRGESLRFHEVFYALMQGYDAYKLKCDVQVGAHDQHFNLLAGRTIQENKKEPPHVMITTPLIPGTDGRKMSKTYGNTINIFDPPNEMYAKTMRVKDEYVPEYLEYTSSLTWDQIDGLLNELRSGANPMITKKALARNLVEQYHGKKAADEAEQAFESLVQQKEAPEDTPIIKVPKRLVGGTWVDLCAELGLSKSKGEHRRLMKQGGFYVEQEPIRDPEALFSIPPEGVMIRIGKRKHYRLVTIPRQGKPLL